MEGDQELRKHMKGVNDWAIHCLKGQKMGHQEGEGRKRTTLKAIKLTRDPRSMSNLVSVNAEEHEV